MKSAKAVKHFLKWYMQIYYVRLKTYLVNVELWDAMSSPFLSRGEGGKQPFLSRGDGG